MTAPSEADGGAAESDVIVGRIPDLTAALSFAGLELLLARGDALGHVVADVLEDEQVSAFNNFLGRGRGSEVDGEPYDRVVDVLARRERKRADGGPSSVFANFGSPSRDAREG